MKLRVGTRRSPLALTQTRQALDELVARRPEVSWELVEIVTTGDRIVDRPLREAGGKGLFLKELDEALLDGRIDCAVHSMKDVPTDLAAGTTLAAVLERVDPRDVLVTAAATEMGALDEQVIVGTTSLRRQAQLLAAMPKARIQLLRGNVQTRLRRLGEGNCEATFLAAAGLLRLGLELRSQAVSAETLCESEAIRAVPGVALDPFVFVPAAGQGALGITARAEDSETLAVLEALDHEESRLAVVAERGFARQFGGGCHLPVAAYAQAQDGRVLLVGLLVSPDGARSIREEGNIDLTTGSVQERRDQAEALGAALGRSFFERGAQAILDLCLPVAETAS